MASHPRRRTPVPLGRPATFGDLLRLPESVVGEIIDGELVTAPRPGLPHARANTRLGTLLDREFDLGDGGPGGWVILAEPYLRLGERIRAPDIAGWRRQRWMDAPRRGPIRLPPDWICEVISPSTGADDRTTKRDLYARHGVKHYWLVDPEARTLEVLRLVDAGWLLAAAFAGDAKVRAEPFDALELDLSLLWLPGDPDDGAEDDEGGDS